MKQKTSEEIYQEKYDNYYKERDQLLVMSPHERANNSAWGHFSLFFYGIFDRKPKEELKQRVIDWAMKFYQKNPDWTKPSMKLWQDRLIEIGQIKKDYKMDGKVLNLLELVENRERRDIELKNEYLGNMAKRMGI